MMATRDVSTVKKDPRMMLKVSRVAGGDMPALRNQRASAQARIAQTFGGA